MGIEKPIIIGYSGSLAYYNPSAKIYRNSFIRDWFWTYNHLSTDPSTRSPFFLFQAVLYLKNVYKIDGKQIQLHLWGNIDERNKLQAKNLAISDIVKIEGYKQKEESLAKMKSCDLLFLPLESETKASKPLFIPGKLFEYLKMGKPVLALGGQSDCTEILKKSGLGIIFESQDTKAIADQLVSFISDKDLLDKYIPDNDYIGQYSFENITRKLAAVFNEALNHK